MNTPAQNDFSFSMTIDRYTEEEDEDMQLTIEKCGQCHDCGDPDTGYCFCVAVGFEAEYANDEEWEVMDKHVEEGYEYEEARRLRISVRKARKRWWSLKNHVVTRRIGFYWFGKTVEKGCMESGPYRAVDMREFKATGIASDEVRRSAPEISAPVNLPPSHM